MAHVNATAAPRAVRSWALRVTPPFRLDLTVWALRRRARNAIDWWDGTTYRREVFIGGRRVSLAVTQPGPPARGHLAIAVTPAVRTHAQVDAVVRRLLGLDVDLIGWYQVAAADARLRPLAERFKGVKPPRFPSLFEALINAFACQQLSLEVGLELINRLAVRCARDGARHAASRRGHDAEPNGPLTFPQPSDVARLRVHSLRVLGFSTQKARAILALARALDRGVLDLDALDVAGDEEAVEQLQALRGIGRWSAEYVLLRGLGRLEVFPGDDVGAQKRLALWLGKRAPLDYAGVRRATRAWQPYAGFVYFHLLLDGLAKAGVVHPE